MLKPIAPKRCSGLAMALGVMNATYYVLVPLFATGLLIGARRSCKPSIRSKDGWVGAVVLVLLFGGLFIAGRMGAEGGTWLFGMALVLFLPSIAMLGFGIALGQWLSQIRRK